MADIGRSEVDFGIETRELPAGPEGRVPPQAIEVEQAVLGSMLIEKEAVPKALEVLDQESFYRESHARIFQAMASLFDKSEPIDVTTVSEELRRRGQLEAVGGAYYLTELTMKVTSAANVEAHAYIVLEKAILRKLIEASSDITRRSYNTAEDPLELLDEAEQKIFEIAERRLKKSSLSLAKAVTQTFEMLERIHGQRGGVIGVPSGFTYLDNLTGGFQQSDLVVIAGRPSQGKTALALSIARNAAVDHGVPVGIFSLEMASQQLVLRLLAAEARVNAHALRTGRLSDEEWPKLSTKCHRLAESKMFIDDTPALGILELRAKARRLKAEHNVGMVIVDYLQLMQGPRDAENREKEISMISRSLKALAKELGIPVIALSQLSRAVEARSGRRPVLSDLRESGAIEQDADVVIFVHRPEIYGDRVLSDGQTPSEGVAEILVGKQRNGPTGQILLGFVKEYARFENLALITEEAIPPTPATQEPPF
jgi:replicative DNA helicase